MGGDGGLGDVRPGASDVLDVAGCTFSPEEILQGTYEFMQLFIRCRFQRMMLTLGWERAILFFWLLGVPTLEREVRGNKANGYFLQTNGNHLIQAGRWSLVLPLRS